jgi:RNA polymerase sigma-70 factor (ECF subfamily)
MSEDAADERLTDESLVRVHLGDPEGKAGREALSCLVSRWSERTYVWAYRFMRERESALDVAQDCLVQMVRALPRYQARGKFSAWLFTIVHHRCLDEIRKRKHERETDADLDGFVSKDAGPEESFERNEHRERVFAAMRVHLEPVERTALWLRAYEGMSVEDITEVLRLDGASGARGVLQTARRKLRAALGASAGTGEGA